ncbi:MAG: carbohydrate porin [Gammaproteobacteria bacterium]
MFARFGWQSDDAAIDYDSLYSVGLNIKGSLWGREDDAIGLGFAHLDGGNGGIDATNALEAYIKFKLFENSALTLDFQYLKDEYKDAEDVKGFVYGARINAEF